MFKKVILILLVIFFVLPVSNKTVFVYGEEDEPQEKTNYEKCMEDKDTDACKALSSNISSNLKDLQEKIANAEKDQNEAYKLADEYSSKAESLQDEIDDLKIKIEELKANIEALQIQIEENEAKVEALNTRVKNRMVEAQKTMHFNGYLEFILGSRSFTDMLQRIYGVEAINSKDKLDREEFLSIIEQLNKDRQELELAKQELDVSYEEVVSKQAELIVMQEFYERKAAEIQISLDELTAERDKVYESFVELREVAGLDSISNFGFVAPVHNSWITSRVWNYSPDFLNGKWHLGVDYAAAKGTPIHAPAGGIIIRADGSCVTQNSLSNRCGEWIAGGGNQVYLVTEVDGRIYGFIFFHMSSVAVEKGDLVFQDDTIGYVGSTGSSSGPHCHIEMYYLGKGTLADALSESYNSTFSVGRGETAYYNRCEYSDGSYRQGAPCILNPEMYLP